MKPAMPMVNRMALRMRYHESGTLVIDGSFLSFRLPTSSSINFLPRQNNRPNERNQDQYRHHLKRKQIIGKQRPPDLDRKSTRLNSSHIPLSRMPSSA